jgi:hypothetical protein
MSRKPYSMTRQLVVATALALGASSVALADDNSMNPLIGDSYRYFNGGHNLGDPGYVKGPTYSSTAVDPAWRQNHPNGISERELQALSSSSVSAAAEQLNPPVASAAADPSWRQAHPNLGESAMQALSSSSLGRWQLPNGTENTASAASDPATVARSPVEETLSARLARRLRPDSGSEAGTN